MSILEVYPPAMRATATLLDGVGAELSAAARGLPAPGGPGRTPATDVLADLSSAAADRLLHAGATAEHLAVALVGAARAYEDVDR